MLVSTVTQVIAEKWLTVAAALAGALTLLVTGGSATGVGVADAFWALFGGGLFGWYGVASPRLAEWRAEVRAVVVVVVVLFFGLLRLPGPTGTESAVGFLACGSLVVSGIRGGSVCGFGSSPISRTWQRRLLRLGVGASLVVICLTGWTTWQMVNLVRDVRGTAIGAVNDLRALDVEAGIVKLEQADQELSRFDDLIESPGGLLMAWIPIAGQHRALARDLVGPLRGVLNEATGFVSARPDETLRVRNGRVDLNGLAALRFPLSELSGAISEFVRVLEADRSPWLVPALTKRVGSLADEVRTYAGTLETTRRVIDELPWLLGADARRTYFVPILSPVENRSGGGFPGAYAVISARQGKLRVEVFGSIGQVGNGGNPFGRIITGPEDYVARYQQYGAGDGTKAAREYFWSNVTASPDHPSVSEVIAQLYPQSGGRPIDGVVTLDVRALAAVLRLTGPVALDDSRLGLSSENAEQYLLRDQYFELNEISNENRRDKIYSAAGAIAQRLTTTDMPAPQQIADTLGSEVKNGNIRMWFAKKTAQDLMRYLGADGAFGEPDSVASVGITNTNGGPNKIDMFLTRKINHKVTVSADGAARAETTIELRNDAPAKGYDDYVLANVKGYPRGTNVTILNYYSPLLDCTATTSGRETLMASELELGWVVHSLYMGVPPRTTVTVKVICTGTLEGAGTGVGTPKVRGQVAANDDEWSVNVEDGNRGWGYEGRLNSNRWLEIESIR